MNTTTSTQSHLTTDDLIIELGNRRFSGRTGSYRLRSVQATRVRHIEQELSRRGLSQEAIAAIR